MAMVTPQQAADNWVRGMQNSTERVKQGVMNVQVSPTERAVNAIPRMVEGIQRAASDGRIERGLRRVTLEDWKRATLDKVTRIGTGASESKGKMAAFMGQLLPFVESGMSQLNSQTPRGDLGQNLARMNWWANYMANFKRSA